MTFNPYQQQRERLFQELEQLEADDEYDGAIGIFKKAMIGERRLARIMHLKKVLGVK